MYRCTLFRFAMFQPDLQAPHAYGILVEFYIKENYKTPIIAYN